MSAQEIAQRVLGELGEKKELVTRITPEYGPCDPVELRERMLRAVASLGKAEVDRIIAEDGKIEIKCEFCQEKAVLMEEDLRNAQSEVETK